MTIKNLDDLIPRFTLIQDPDGKKHTFIRVDDEGDIVVECRAAMGGFITLYRDACSLVDNKGRD